MALEIDILGRKMNMKAQNNDIGQFVASLRKYLV